MRGIPRGMSPKMMAKMMKHLGIKVEEITGVRRVTLELENKALVVEKPRVMMIRHGSGEEKILQIEGRIIEEEMGEEKPLDIPEEDIALVAEKAGVDKGTAERVLREEKGDIASAILKLKASGG